MKAIEYFCKIKEVKIPVIIVAPCPNRYNPVKYSRLPRRSFVLKTRKIYKDKETIDDVLLESVFGNILKYVKEKEIEKSDLIKELSNIPKEMLGHKKVILTNASQETLDKYQETIEKYISDVAFFKVDLNTEDVKDMEFFCLIDAEKNPVDIYIMPTDDGFVNEKFVKSQVILNDSGNYKLFKLR